MTNGPTILIVDDKANVRMLLREYLSEQGFNCVTANNGRDALFVARESKPDLILLDIMMPEMDGYEFIRLWRREHDTPIILLTAKLEESDKVVGLELGADDYVTKPFGMRELLARVRATLRRATLSTTPKDVLTVADLWLDKQSRQARVGERAIKLTPSEFELLATFMTTPQHVYSREELLTILQGPLSNGTGRTVDVHIRNLRTKIEPDPSEPIYIETVFGIGYRLLAT